MKNGVKLLPRYQPQVMLTVPYFGKFREKERKKMKPWNQDVILLITVHNGVEQRDLDKTRCLKTCYKVTD